MTTHIFVVNTTTFKYHLEYMFAGTGAAQRSAAFLTDGNISYQAASERNLVSMIADVSRIREGDRIIFYVQATEAHQGGFFGVFKAKGEAFYDDNESGKNYLKRELGKELIFRVIIEPDTVYPLGVTEHEFLDSLDGIEKPYQMQWSLIYRKLKGNRGCTMITDYECDRLLKKIDEKNNGRTIKGGGYTYDEASSMIEAGEETKPYMGQRYALDIKKRLLYKANKRNAFETHLQAYILQNIDKNPLRSLLMPEEDEEFWIGNEVSCGVGMQRIDLLVIQKKETRVHIKIIELKDEEPEESILDYQLSWYIEWIIDYVVPNYEQSGLQVHLYPCIMAKAFSARNKNGKRISERIKNEILQHSATSAVVHGTEYIGFGISRGGGDITFTRLI